MINIMRLQEIKRCTTNSRAARAGLRRSTDLKKRKSMYADHAIATATPQKSQRTLIVQSNDFAAGDNRDQMAHMPVSQSNHGRYPLKNESIRRGSETF
jgi:hypothetical protein